MIRNMKNDDYTFQRERALTEEPTDRHTEEGQELLIRKVLKFQ